MCLLTTIVPILPVIVHGIEISLTGTEEDRLKISQEIFARSSAGRLLDEGNDTELHHIPVERTSIINDNSEFNIR